MKDFKTLIPVYFLIFASMASLGWMMNYHHHQTPEVQSDATTKSNSSTHERKSGNLQEIDYGSLIYAKQRVAQILAIRDPRERQRATLELAESIPAKEIIKWLKGDWFGSSEGFDLSLFEHTLKERLKHERPLDILTITYNSTDTLIDAAIANPEATVDFFKENKLDDRTNSVFAKIAEKSPQLAFDVLIASFKSKPNLAKSPGLSGASLTDIIKKLELSQPGLVESRMSDLPIAMRTEAIAGVFSAKFTQDISTALQELSGRSDKVQIFQSLKIDEKTGMSLIENAASLSAACRSYLAVNILNISHKDPQALMDLDYSALGFSQNQISNVYSQLIPQMAQQDPVNALTHIDLLDPDDNYRSNMLRQILSNVKDPQTAQLCLNQISDPTQKELAEKILEDKLAQVKPTPDSTLPELQESTNISDWATNVFDRLKNSKNSDLSYNFIQQVKSIPSDKRDEFLTELSNLSTQDQVSIVNSAMRYGSYGDENIKAIITSGIKSNIEAGELNFTQTGDLSNSLNAFYVEVFVSNWVNNDSEAATQWLGSLPMGEAKKAIQQNLVTRWSLNDYEATEKWVKTLSTTEQAALKPVLEKSKAKSK